MRFSIPAPFILGAYVLVVAVCLLIWGLSTSNQADDGLLLGGMISRVIVTTVKPRLEQFSERAKPMGTVAPLSLGHAPMLGLVHSIEVKPAQAQQVMGDKKRLSVLTSLTVIKAA